MFYPIFLKVCCQKSDFGLCSWARAQASCFELGASFYSTPSLTESLRHGGVCVFAIVCVTTRCCCWVFIYLPFSPILYSFLFIFMKLGNALNLLGTHAFLFVMTCFSYIPRLIIYNIFFIIFLLYFTYMFSLWLCEFPASSHGPKICSQADWRVCS